jgi:cytidylate kinase
MNTATSNPIEDEPRIKIIALERELGAGGSEIADRLATRLGWKLLDHSLTDAIAKLAHVSQSDAQRCDEHLDPILYRLTKVFQQGGSETSVPIENLEVFDADRSDKLMRSIITEAASVGNCVLVGRGAPWFLHGRADTFRVYLFAPRSYKIQRILARLPDESAANLWLDMVSRHHAAFLKHYYGGDWQVHQVFHLMINTSVGPDLVVDTICQFKIALDTQRSECLTKNQSSTGEP